MKRCVVIFSLWALYVASAADTNSVAPGGHDMLLRSSKAGRSTHPLLITGEPVLLMEPIDSPALRELFPEFTSYRLIASRDLLHQADVSALLIDTNGSPTHLQSDEHVAFFAGQISRKVQSKNDALKLVRAFAGLRSYRIVETAPKFADARPPEKRPEPKETDYRFLAEDRRDHWRVFATFFTSEHSGNYERYVFTIWKSPGAGIRLEPPVLIRLRNYVF